jgi:hypothetical protein
MLSGPVVMLYDSVGERNSKLLRHHRCQQRRAIVSGIGVHFRVHADFNPDAGAVPLARSGVEPLFIGRQALEYRGIIHSKVPGHIPLPCVRTLLILRMRRGIRPSAGVVGVVNGDLRRSDLGARAIRVSHRDQILHDAQPGERLIKLHDGASHPRDICLARDRSRC